MLGCMTARLFYKKFIDLECQDGADTAVTVSRYTGCSSFSTTNQHQDSPIFSVHYSSCTRPMIIVSTCSLCKRITVCSSQFVIYL